MKTEILTHQGYKKAFKCSKCPQNNGPDGCPVWLDTVSTDHDTKQQKVQKGCGFQMIPMFLVNIAKVEDTRAAEISAMKEEVVRSVTDASLMYLDKHAKEADVFFPTGKD